MLEDYFREVAANNWYEFTDRDYKELIDGGSFRVIEKFNQIGDLPKEDILIYLNYTVKNYHVFLIKENRLAEVHQEHGFRWCLTCAEMSEKSPYFSHEEAGDSSAISSPF